MSSVRAGQPGATRVCPHCKATVLESAAVCPGCRHHLRFNAGKQLGVDSYSALSIDGTIAHKVANEPCEYCVVLDVRNERGEQVLRQVVGVGALQPGELRRVNVSVEMLPVASQASSRSAAGAVSATSRPSATPATPAAPASAPSPATGAPAARVTPPAGAPAAPIPPAASGAAVPRPALQPPRRAGTTAPTAAPTPLPAAVPPTAAGTARKLEASSPAGPLAQRLRIFRKP